MVDEIYFPLGQPMSNLACEDRRMKVTFENSKATGKGASKDRKKEGFWGNGGFIRLNPTESDRSIFHHGSSGGEGPP